MGPFLHSDLVGFRVEGLGFRVYGFRIGNDMAIFLIVTTRDTGNCSKALI